MLSIQYFQVKLSKLILTSTLVGSCAILNPPHHTHTSQELQIYKIEMSYFVLEEISSSMPLWLTLGKVSERNIQKGGGVQTIFTFFNGVQIIFTLFRGSTDQFQHFLIVKGWGGKQFIQSKEGQGDIDKNTPLKVQTRLISILSKPIKFAV